MTRTGHFHRELLQPPRSFYERELGRLSRPNGKRWSFGCCPFHDSKSRKSFSVNIDTGGYVCFGCGIRGGDIVAFVMARYGLNFKQACIRLGAWAAVVTDADRRAMAERERRREQQRAEEAAGKEASRQQRIEARDWLHCLEHAYDQINEHLSELRKGTAEEVTNETERCWEILALGVPAIRQAEAEYFRLAGVTVG